MPQCLIIRPGEYTKHFVGSEESHSFHYPTQVLSALAEAAARTGKQLVSHIVRIEVRDTEDHLHMHAGMTIVLVTAGHGIFRDETGEYAVSTGDRIVVPPMTPHLSIAAPYTVMIEDGIYTSTDDDPQLSISVPG
ncbi:MAG: AraC family ligand binding domain-containing protein [Candidatus Paceibacterota bacterium]